MKIRFQDSMINFYCFNCLVKFKILVCTKVELIELKLYISFNEIQKIKKS